MSVRIRAILGLTAILLSTAAVADEPLPDWFAQSAVPSGWRWTPDVYPVEGISTYRLTPAIAFEDANLLIRYRDARSLSLLTVAEFGRSRLFFGVNEDGLLGLHFRAERPDRIVAASDILDGL